MVSIDEFQLKELTSNDLFLVLRWRNSDRIRSVMYTEKQISWSEHYKWYQKVSADSRLRVWIFYRFAQPLGLVSISNINPEHSRCYWGFYIGDDSAPKGSGTIMGMLALNKIFEEIKLNKVCAEVISTNTGSLSYHKKLGFKEEGLFKNHLRKNNNYVDIIPMAIFSSQWEISKDKLFKRYNRKGEENE
ncbi:UDP-4-amino-4,6-dideoxy-N-acetyl-beta-L-altrosamine N-acetyltransferase [Halalkalibacillus halophilus]|uniref:UDP-4-amino-4, 6-dideoxy-N-acetyl-beta-L-altrosamine N-acetyltransferase n=1 Tax=Halalkalibacillus halophilus TaxID=392827 RepID=UPI0003FFEA9D|nr:UDP-4-amino-4,6-dideoxy-N-acetyl-beta-L-altrosamine N-acetyltransferase [Halalkalibacillus halophilus]